MEFQDDNFPHEMREKTQAPYLGLILKIISAGKKSGVLCVSYAA